MNDKRFDAWWASNPARESLNPVAKEVARGIWRAAQQDLATELLVVAPQPTFKEMADALWISQLGVIPACTNSDSWNCKYCNKTATCAALAAQGDPAVKGGPC